MSTLPKNWLTEGLIDFEYKKYILLSYTQQVKGSFKERKLYDGKAIVDAPDHQGDYWTYNQGA